jgi:ankyrin repeat protein
LLTRQRAPMQDGNTALHATAAAGKEGAMQVLLDAGANQEAKDKVRGERGRERADG